jgi:tetratricopeptide (TPR) repeat protein
MKRLIFCILTVILAAGCAGEPESVEELRKAGTEAFLDADYARAREYFLKAISRKPSDQQLLYFTGLAYKRDYLMDSALFYLKRADYLHPDNRELNHELYTVAIAVGEWEYAKEALMTLIRTGDPVEMHYAALADVWNKMGSWGNVFHYLRKMYREVGIEEKGQFLLLAGVAAQGDSIALANEVLDSIETRFGPGEDLSFVESKVRFFEGDWAAAETLLRELVAMNEGAVEYKINLANALANQDSEEKKREALELFMAARPYAPNPEEVDSSIARLERYFE